VGCAETTDLAFRQPHRLPMATSPAPSLVGAGGQGFDHVAPVAIGAGGAFGLVQQAPPRAAVACCSCSRPRTIRVRARAPRLQRSRSAWACSWARESAGSFSGSEPIGSPGARRSGTTKGAGVGGIGVRTNDAISIRAPDRSRSSQVPVCCGAICSYRKGSQ